ncbi:uncharacterized protein MONOS_23 [Monocercomonoides exilis]|uniref:uncharacterized protein n=1 Tax=Monocercomonoides exilis TaxID=2049356 RepID=UPI00355A491A|nr:hypothetical protein MONOS_23 [Monocercomonoides exilis]|eukprot:MONOS_23.1-p1 / transcript=MONOS_23.1 / gene=MONOS_23 / organism=Monocercomonoides_exilis_PA203 / gene_product=unspecified product / transcript_product=unspecified product / location=Mono_scaffold00001:57884-59223(-) / protein_length=399 / sequence_SO=supercontig / SO=protein_coding / is_pseudo=false
MGSFVLEGVTFSGRNAWKMKKVFISGNELDDFMSNEKLKEELSSNDEKSWDELCGWERKTTGEEGYVIPLVVYLWANWSKDGFVSKEKGGDFSGCGFSEAPCSSIDHLISLRYNPLGKGESQISIGDSWLLSHPISFSPSLPPASQDSELPKVVIKATAKRTGVTITDEDGNAAGSGAMISSNVSLSFVNVSFIKPSITTDHEVFIESSGTNTLLSVTDCSFGSLTGLTETAGYCVMRVNGGSAAIQSCQLNKINELKGFIAFSPIVYCSLENIKNEGSSASVIELGSFENAIDCTIEDCTMSTCRSDLSTEGGGMKVVLKSEESVLKVNNSSFSMCKCSTETGRGGGLFIDGADSNANDAEDNQIPHLNFNIVNIMFYSNEEHEGNDIFIKCFWIEK